MKPEELSEAAEAFQLLLSSSEDYHYFSLSWKTGLKAWECTVSLKIGHPSYKDKYGQSVFDIWATTCMGNPLMAVQTAISTLHARARGKVEERNQYNKPEYLNEFYTGPDFDELAKSLGL